jgi:acyl carrier protein
VIEQSVNEARFANITADIMELITEITGVTTDGIRSTDDLYNAGLKSLAAIRLIAALEDRFDIEFPETVLHRGAFSTIDRIRATLVALLPSDTCEA